MGPEPACITWEREKSSVVACRFYPATTVTELPRFTCFTVHCEMIASTMSVDNNVEYKVTDGQWERGISSHGRGERDSSQNQGCSKEGATWHYS